MIHKLSKRNGTYTLKIMDDIKIMDKLDEMLYLIRN